MIDEGRVIELYRGGISTYEIAPIFGYTPNGILSILRRNNISRRFVGRVGGKIGFPHSEETKKRIGGGNRGKVRSDELRKRWSDAAKGKRAWNKGIQLTPEQRVPYEDYWNSLSGRTGELNSNWRGGWSIKNYPKDWKEKLKIKIRERDSYTCQICRKCGNCVHHIDGNKYNCQEENLINLCRRCHGRVHSKKNREASRIILNNINEKRGEFKCPRQELFATPSQI